MLGGASWQLPLLERLFNMDPSRASISKRTTEFCSRFGLKVPILLGPMAGVPAPGLSVAVCNAGGLGSCGALLFGPSEISNWVREVRAATSGPVQMNLWVPDPEPVRDMEHEARVRAFLSRFGPEPKIDAGDARPPSFQLQCEALLEEKLPLVSSVMGLFPAHFVAELKQRKVAWIATVSTVREARQAEAAGADVIAAQGMEAGGHRGAFNAALAERELVGLCSLIPAVVDAVSIPVVAAGGIADGRGIAAALMLGASAVQIGTGFLRTPEAQIDSAWADALVGAAPEDTVVSRVFSGRPARSLATGFVKAATTDDAPEPAPYPVQRGLTAALRAAAAKSGHVDNLQAWAGQSAALAQAKPAGKLVFELWREACELLALGSER